jgi:arylsulfatase A-like enzyme
LPAPSPTDRSPSKSGRIATVGTLALLAAFAIGVVGLLSDSPSASRPAVAGAPNVVVVMTDDQGTRSLPRMRHVREELQREGTTFTNFFASFPLCCPSRATLLTGQYAHNHGVLDNKPPEGGYEALDHAGTLPIAMRRAGYRTGYIGKYLNGYARRGNDRREVPPGWSEWYVRTDGDFYDYEVNENGRLRRYGDDESDYRTDVSARRARDFIRRGAERPEPFFLVLSTQAPHTETGEGPPDPRPAPRHRGRFRSAPLPRPPSFNEADLSDKPHVLRERPRKNPQRLKRVHRDRLRSLLAVDEAVKGVVDELEAAGELEDTLIVYTSDNGYFLGEHRLEGKAKRNALYDEAVRVPFVVRGPGFPPGAEREQIAGNIDLAPTILEAAGAEPGREPDGRSLRPLAADPDADAGRDILLEDIESKAVRTARFMYARHPDGQRELYDLERDPFQLENRAGDRRYRAHERRLEARLRQLRDCAGQECRRPAP